MALPAIDRFVQTLGLDTQAYARNTPETASVLDFSIARHIRSFNKTIASSEKYRNSMIEFSDYLSSFRDVEQVIDGIFDLDDALSKADHILSIMNDISDRGGAPYFNDDFNQSIERLAKTISRKSSDSGRIIRRLASKLKGIDQSLLDPQSRANKEIDRIVILVVEAREWILKQISISSEQPLRAIYINKESIDYADKRRNIMSRYERSLSYLAK